MSTSYQRKLATLRDHEHPFAPFVRILGKGKTGSRSLDRDEARQAMGMILRGEVEELQLGAFLMLLRVKEESAGELAGFVEAARESIAAPADCRVDLDWASYAGKKRQLPWFLLSCLAMADQGVRIFMHGASGHTQGRLYTEQVLESLGIAVARDWQTVSSQLDQQQFSFMPLSSLCPPLQQIIDFRNYLGLRSPVHTLSRLLNPLHAPCSMQSIFHPSYADTHQQAAALLGQPHAAVFKGEGGEIERKPEATCVVKRVDDGCLSEQTWQKLTDGRQPQPESLDIGEMRAIWRGEAGNSYAELAITGTMAIALSLLGRAPSQQEALATAEQWWQQRDRSRLQVRGRD